MINPFIRCNEENLIDNINKKFGEVSSEIGALLNDDERLKLAKLLKGKIPYGN